MTITLSQTVLYSIALTILWMTPGPVWVAILARSISGGFRSSVPLIFGVALGDLLWPLVALLGLSYLISLYSDILIIMGLFLIINSKKIFSVNSHLTKPGHWAGFIAGFSAVLANPKASLFYMTLLPNFFVFNTINFLDILFICCLSAFVPMVGNLILAGTLGKIRKYLLSSSAMLKINIFSGISLIIVGLFITIL